MKKTVKGIKGAADAVEPVIEQVKSMAEGQPRELTQEEVIAYLQKTHIHFAIPCYGGQVTENTFASMIRFTMLAMKHNIPFSLDTMVNESLIPRGRNNLVAKFLANPAATHLMWVDADIRFEPESILRLALHNVGVACGLYPMKGIPIKYVLNIVPGARRNGSLFEVSTAGTGFMLIKREIIENLCKAMPETKYKDSLNLGAQYEPHMYALFDTMIDDNGHYLSEDWTFCKRVREVLKTPIWIDTEIKLDHMGAYNFAGDVNQISKLVEQWTKNEDIKSADDQIKAYEFAPKDS
jgi:hypothetical protein